MTLGDDGTIMQHRLKVSAGKPLLRASARLQSAMASAPVTPPKVEITVSKQVMREEFELLPFDVSMGFMRNRVNVEYAYVDFAYLNSNCAGLYMFFNEHGYLGTQALGFELEDDMAMFILKFQGT
jgi:hypothetical protein